MYIPIWEPSCSTRASTIEAVPAFEKAVELGANNYDSWGNLGDAYRWSSEQERQSQAGL